jgi:hypothetical protein
MVTTATVLMEEMMSVHEILLLRENRKRFRLDKVDNVDCEVQDDASN